MDALVVAVRTAVAAAVAKVTEVVATEDAVVEISEPQRVTYFCCAASFAVIMPSSLGS